MSIKLFLTFSTFLLLILHAPPVVKAQEPVQRANREDTEVAQDEAWFAERAQASSAFLTLTDGVASALLQRANWDSGEYQRVADGMKGIFENNAAWPVERIAVCFFDIDNQLGVGAPEYLELKQDIAAIASEWNAITGVPDLDFGPAAAPNRCSGNKYMIAVEITRQPSGSQVGKISWSYARYAIPSMNLELSKLQSATPGMRRHLVLHEFGHALGLLHEIRHADGNCWERFDLEKLYTYYSEELGIADREYVKKQLSAYDRPSFGSALSFTTVDQNSVMMYSFPKSVYRDASPPCWTSLNSEISAGDRLTLLAAYRLRGVGAMQLASLADRLPESGRRTVDAYIALQTAPPVTQGELLSAIQGVENVGSANLVADTLFAAAHSPAIQSILKREEALQASQNR